MKEKTANLSRLNILGNGDCSSDREIFAAIVKRCRRKLGYCSIFAAFPAILASHVAEARSDEAKKPAASTARERARMRLERLSMSGSIPALLKRQSEFRLPHQKGGFSLLAALAGNDDCPGRPVQGGNYTAAAPYIDSGDTTGANDTVSRAHYIDYHYYNWDAFGPDHVYSFTLTGRGPNPQIEVSTSSGTYRPLIYVLQGGVAGGCPAGTGNLAYNELMLFDSRWGTGNTATIDRSPMNFLPLNVPLHLFVDSRFNDASGSGSYALRIQDVTIAPACPNSIDCAEFFVRQHYLDFLGREPDASGLAFWSNEIASCGADLQCVEVKRINVSAAFFLSIENHATGYLTHRAYKVAYGNLPNKPVPLTLQEYLAGGRRLGDGVQVGVGNWQQRLEANKAAFFNEFIATARFTSLYPQGMNNGTFVDALNQNAGFALSQAKYDSLVEALNGGAMTRAQALRAVAEDSDFAQGPERNRAFVLAQYFGYLRRNPDDVGFDGQPDPNFDGFNFWLGKLNQFGGDFQAAEMVKAFLVSVEYRQRFSPS